MLMQDFQTMKKQKMQPFDCENEISAETMLTLHSK